MQGYVNLEESMKLPRFSLWLPAVVLAVVLAGCARDPEPEPIDHVGTEGMHDMSAMAMDTAMVRRHADEMETQSARLRTHVQQMRAAGPDGWQGRMNEHAALVSEVLTTMDEHMREMHGATGMDHAHMSGMMGADSVRHREMMEETEVLRTEIAELGTADAATVRAGMPAHLDRLERMAGRMEEGVAHMRAGHGHGQH
jgi:hypothetical protein